LRESRETWGAVLTYGGAARTPRDGAPSIGDAS
jgi:hypothetical protein